MKKYSVDISVSLDRISIEAENEDEAREKAFEYFRRNWAFTGDSDVYIEEVDE